MRAGIYKITIGRWFYWGSTNNFCRRKKEHLSLLRTGKHRNSILQNAYNKHNLFEFEIIANVEQQELAEWEQELIDVWFGSENCANLSPIVGIPAGTKGKTRKPHSEEAKVRMSAAAKGKLATYGFKHKKHSEETKARMSAARKLYHERKREEKVNG